MEYSKCKFYNVFDKDIHPWHDDSFESDGYVKFKSYGKADTIFVPVNRNTPISIYEINNFFSAIKEDDFVHILMKDNKIIGMMADSSECFMGIRPDFSDRKKNEY